MRQIGSGDTKRCDKSDRGAVHCTGGTNTACGKVAEESLGEIFDTLRSQARWRKKREEVNYNLRESMPLVKGTPKWV